MAESSATRSRGHGGRATSVAGAPGPSGDRAGTRRRARPRGRLRGFFDRYWYAWAMTTPVLIVMGVLIGYPLVRGIYLSMTNATEMNVARHIGANDIPATYDFVGLDNYVHILSDGAFLRRLTWTVVWTVGCIIFHVGLGLGLAVLLNRRIKFRSVYRMLLILPWAVPPFVSAFIWRYLYNGDYGVFNAMLRAVGLPEVSWLGDPTTAKIAVIVVNVWLGVPFMMLALLGGLQAIQRELYEAAAVDGASPWQRFRHITVPGLRPVSNTVVLIGTIWTFNQFGVIYLVTGGGPGDSTEILVTYAFRDAFEGIRDYSGSAAYGVLILLLLMGMAIGYRRALRRQGEVW